MKYKCRKCETTYKPGKFYANCPKCGASDVEIVYDHRYAMDIRVKAE